MLPKGERIFPYSTDAISASFIRACKILAIDDLRFHDLRHEGISHLFETGRTIPQVAAVSGHRSWTSLKRYTDIRQSSDKYANWKWNIGAPRNCFFGVLKYVSKQITEPQDCYDFFWESYGRTSMGKLLEFIRDWPNIEALRARSKEARASLLCALWRKPLETTCAGAKTPHKGTEIVGLWGASQILLPQ